MMKHTNVEIIVDNKIEHTFSHVRNQFIAVLCVNLISIAHGCGTGWISPTILTLRSDNSPLGPITTEQVSWLGSSINIGGMVGNILFTLINKYYGRKIGLCIMAFPNMIFWLLVIFSNDIRYLYAARIFAGFTGGGTLICIPLFVAEIVSPHVRGNLGSYYVLSMNVGALFSFIVGSYLPYHIVPCIHIVFPILYFIGVLFLPDTPLFLLKQGKVEAAEKSLRFYNNCSKNTKANNERFNVEFTKLKEFVNSTDNANDTVKLRDICTPQARRGLTLGTILITLNIFSGGFLLIYYAGSIFRDSGSDLDPKMSSIIMMSVQLVGTYIATFLVDLYGRRPVMMVSTFGSAVGLGLLGGFSYLTHNGNDMTTFNWIPIASFSLAIFSLSLGIMPLSFVILAEVLPAKIRSFGSTYCIFLLCFMLFVLSKLFPIFCETIGLYMCIWFFALTCALGFLFACFVLPETNGKTLNA